MLKKFILLLVFIPNFSFAIQCKFPIFFPFDGSTLTKQEWDMSIREVKNYLRTSGISNAQIIQMLRDEMNNYKPGYFAYDNMIEEANNLCKQVGPNEYNSIINCIKKLSNEALKDLGLNLPISIINESFNMLPSCTSGSNQNLNKMEKQNFEDFCKKSTLGSLDEDVALLCLDKLS